MPHNTPNHLANSTKQRPAGRTGTPGVAISDVLIAFGGAASVKAAVAATETEAALPNGADGYLVRFSTADDPDITAQKDFFTKDTYFGEATKVPVYFHHGLPIEVKMADGSTKTFGPGKVKIGVGELKTDDTGVFIDAVLDESGEYVTAVQQLLEAGVLGWSSGSASHLVTREAVADDNGTTKAHNIKQWLLAEASLTHTPAEPRNVASPVLTSVKSLLGQYGAYSYDYEYGSPPAWNPTEKMGCAAADVLIWRLERAVDNILSDEDLTPAQQIEAIVGVFDEAKGLLTRLVNALAVVDVAEDDTTEADLLTATKSAFLKHVAANVLPPATKGAETGEQLSLADQGQKVLEAVEAYTKRAGNVHTMRAKAGRTLSPAHGEIAGKALVAFNAMKNLVDPSNPGTEEETTPAAATVPPATAPKAEEVKETPASDAAGTTGTTSATEDATKTTDADAVAAMLAKANELGL
jgi:hypothetical protein